ncbi:MAG: hypothetical protein E3J88_03880 [Anaerolineales bacterium]|nr:MAG: hypothetical protein E3J88_03880 [Anaerolineales bacterium]
MPENETTSLEEPGITITNVQATIGRHAYITRDITDVDIREVKQRPSIAFLLIVIAVLVAAYFIFRNILGVLLIFILLTPYLFGYIKPKARYLLEVTTKEKTTHPVISPDQEVVQRVADALNLARQQGAEYTPESFQYIDETIKYSPAGVEGEFFRTIPQNCPKCDKPLNIKAVEWVDEKHGICPRCYAPVEITWRKI